MSVQAAHQVVITVTGMTCQHCASAVTEELRALNGVQGVDVTLSNGEVTIRSNRALTDAEMAEAVNEAGYSVT
jgi:copper chaperone CopZ